MIGGMRSHILYAVLLLVLTAWSLDFLTSDAGPKTAQALVAASLPDEAGAIASEDLQSVLSALRSMPNQRPPLELGTRNLFAHPVPPPSQVLVEQSGTANPGEPQQLPQAQPAVPDFALHGILSGRRRMAVINGQVYTRGQKVGEYEVRSIGRETVVLRGPAGRVRLELEQPSLHTGNN